jgi:DNA repair protein RadC
MILYLTNAQKNTNPIAHRLIRQFGNFKGVLGASISELMSCEGVGERTAQFIKLFQEFFIRSNAQSYKSAKLNSQKKVKDYLIDLFSFETAELPYAICLDANNNLISPIELAHSNTKSSAIIDNDSAVRKVILSGAKKIVLAHNHLQDGAIPTQSDIDATKVLMQKLLAAGIIVHDHIIVHKQETLSFAEQGWIKLWADNMLSPAQAQCLYSSHAQISSGGSNLAEHFGLKII